MSLLATLSACAAAGPFPVASREEVGGRGFSPQHRRWGYHSGHNTSLCDAFELQPMTTQRDIAPPLLPG